MLHRSHDDSPDCLFRGLIEHIPIVTTIFAGDDAQTLTFISPQVEPLLGITPEEALGDPSGWFSAIHPEDRERVDAERRRATASGGRFRADYRRRRKDGQYVWVREELAPVHDDLGRLTGWHGALLDLSEHKSREQRLVHQALHDPLTGLPNRALFLRRLAQALAENRADTAVAVVFLDLDNFKLINDSLGHETGDRVLQEAAARLRRVLRPADVLGRLGGDEFCAIAGGLPGATAERAAGVLARRLAEALQPPLLLADGAVTLTASTGVAVTSDRTLRPDALLRMADLAMYHAKHTGKGRIATFDTPMQTLALDRLTKERALRRAISEDQLQLYVQPKVALATGEVVGLEALVRWQHPDGTLHGPGSFIALAEETGLIVQLGEWIFHALGRHIEAWQQARTVQELPVSINLSAVEFQQPELAARVSALLAATRIPPRRICLEMTEGAMMADSAETVATLNALAALGVHLAIDDFGVGYSSLAHLKRFRLHELKIDRQFVEGLGNDLEDTIIVSGMIGLAHALGLVVVAEGVETAEQVTYLLELGCDVGQGYLFAPPFPAEELPYQLAHLDWSPQMQARQMVQRLTGTPADGERVTHTGELRARLMILDTQRERLDLARERLSDHLASVRRTAAGQPAPAPAPPPAPRR